MGNLFEVDNAIAVKDPDLKRLFSHFRNLLKSMGSKGNSALEKYEVAFRAVDNIKNEKTRAIAFFITGEHAEDVASIICSHLKIKFDASRNESSVEGKNAYTLLITQEHFDNLFRGLYSFNEKWEKISSAQEHEEQEHEEQEHEEQEHEEQEHEEQEHEEQEHEEQAQKKKVAQSCGTMGDVMDFLFRKSPEAGGATFIGLFSSCVAIKCGITGAAIVGLSAAATVGIFAGVAVVAFIVAVALYRYDKNNRAKLSASKDTMFAASTENDSDNAADVILKNGMMSKRLGA